jgi:C-terminal processing protease CtpA/Prc
MLAACGGGGSGGSSPGAGITPTPSPSPTTSACSLAARQNWALTQLQEWYLFPSLLNSTVNAASYSTVQGYIDALVAPARAQGRDRYFTYLTSISEENAYYEQGATAGFGMRFTLDFGNRLLVNEAFEGGTALANGIDRGAEILGIGTDGNTIRSVSSILASGGTGALIDALGPDTNGTVRVFHFRDQAGVERRATLTKSVYALDPVSDRYGAKIIMDGAKKVGYINLRTFIGTANSDLRTAFADFKAQGVTELIIDLRYNGGGLISVAEFLGDLMAEGRGGKIFDYITLRDSKAFMNGSYSFRPMPESIAPTKVAFIATEGTASASEMVVNGMVPYLGTQMALIGTNTYGKPVGQIALDRPECDDRLRAIALKTENADHQGEYYNGLATTVQVTCSAADDISHQLGDPDEGMTRVALDFLAGRSCNSILTATATASISGVKTGGGRALLTRAAPQSTPQRELPGAF